MKKQKSIISFFVLASFIMLTACDVGVKTQDGKTIKTIIIGNQEWTTENLDVNTFNNGEEIQETKNADEWATAGKNKKSACCYYENDPENGKKFGKLYNWYAVNDSRGLAPRGWHVPSDKEWKQLIDYLGGNEAACIKLKSSSDWGKFGNGTNESGFSCLPGGQCFYAGRFYMEIGTYGNWWSSTEYTIDFQDAWMVIIKSNNSEVNFSYGDKNYGCSVRFVKDKS